MSYIKFDSSKLDKFVHANELEQMQPLVTAADKELREGTGAGKDLPGSRQQPRKFKAILKSLLRLGLAVLI